MEYTHATANRKTDPDTFPTSHGPAPSLIQPIGAVNLSLPRTTMMTPYQKIRFQRFVSIK